VDEKSFRIAIFWLVVCFQFRILKVSFRFRKKRKEALLVTTRREPTRRMEAGDPRPSSESVPVELEEQELQEQEQGHAQDVQGAVEANSAYASYVLWVFGSFVGTCKVKTG